MTEKNSKELNVEITSIGQMASMLDEGLLLTNSDGVVLSANRAAIEFFNDDLVTQSIFDVIDDQAFGQAFHRTALKRVELELSLIHI